MSDEIRVQSKNKKTKFIIAIAAVVIAVLTIVAIVLGSSNSATAKKVKEQLSLGEKYLSELQYEQAIAAYELAIKIDPKNVEAYLALAEIYIEIGDLEKAEEILEKAVEELGGETEDIKKMREKVRKKQSDSEENPVVTGVPISTPIASSEYDVYGTFKTQVVLDGVYVEAENLAVSQNYATGEIKITINGIILQDSYLTNRSTSRKDVMEYGWQISLASEDYVYQIATCSWAFHPGEENIQEIANMQHSIWKCNEQNRSFSVIGDVEMQYTTDSITWIFTMPEEYELDIAEVKCYKVDIIEASESVERREYIPAS